MQDTAENRFWKSFRAPYAAAAGATRKYGRRGASSQGGKDKITLFGPVTCLDFSPVPSTTYDGYHDFVATSSKRVTIYCGRTGIAKKVFRRFAGQSSGAKYRPTDGKLIVCGDGSSVKIMQVEASGAVLRTLKGHDDVVTANAFSAFDALRVASVSNDKSLRIWDLTEGTCVDERVGHDDYVRCIAESPMKGSGEGSMWATGSYDHTVRLWDTRESNKGPASMILNHGDPVDAVVYLSSTVIASAGGSTIKIWDLSMQRRSDDDGERMAPMQILENHQKAVTGLVLSSSKRRMLSAGVDGHVKVFDTTSFQVCHSMRFSGASAATKSTAASSNVDEKGGNKALLSLALAPNGESLAVGSATGDVMLRTRSKGRASSGDVDEENFSIFGASSAKKTKYAHGASQRNFNRGFNAPIDPSVDTVVVNAKKRKLRKHDKLLKKFQYRQALDAALETLDPVQISGVIDELVYRSGLTIALQRRNDPSDLIPLLKFLVRYISVPRYSKLLLRVCSDVVDLYAPTLGQNVRVDELFFQLQHRVELELRMQTDLAPIKGSIDALLSASVNEGVF
eukprot:g5296.t1